MRLDEIFSSKFPTTWKTTPSGYEGQFTIDADLITVVLDEYEIVLNDRPCSLLDFGFKKNNSWKLQPNSSQFKTFGGVFNAVIPKINSLKPQVILFGAQNRNGSVEERVKAYHTMSRMLAKGSSYQYESEWFKTANGTYKYISSVEPTEQDLKNITDTAESVQQKD